MTAEHLRLRTDAVEWREIDGEIVALDGRTSSYLAANATGALLWHALAAGTTRQELVDTLVQQFDLEAERARVDVDRFLAQLAEAGILED